MTRGEVERSKEWIEDTFIIVANRLDLPTDRVDFEWNIEVGSKVSVSISSNYRKREFSHVSSFPWEWIVNYEEFKVPLKRLIKRSMEKFEGEFRVQFQKPEVTDAG